MARRRKANPEHRDEAGRRARYSLVTDVAKEIVMEQQREIEVQE
jgi:hypothetical protein